MGGLPTLLEISAMGCCHFPVGRVIEKDEILRGVQTRHHDVMKRAFETPFTKADDEWASFGKLLLQGVPITREGEDTKPFALKVLLHIAGEDPVGVRSIESALDGVDRWHLTPEAGIFL